MGPSYGADAAAKVPYSGPGPGIWDLNLVGPDQKARKNVVLNFAMSFCISLAYIQDLFEEWGQPIPIVVEYLEDEVELRAIVTNVNMHPKAIDFSM